MTAIIFTQADVTLANVERHHHIVPIIRKRMLAMWLLFNDYSRVEIAKIVGICAKTLKNYIAIFRKAGLAGLVRLDYKARTSNLQPQRTTIEAEFHERPPRSVKEANKRIQDLTGLKLSNSQIARFLRHLGMRPLRTGSMPAKADVARQKEFLDTNLTPLIAKAKAGEINLFFMDASHYILCPYAAILWSFARVFIRATAGRNRINVLGALNACTLELETVINTTYINAQTIAEMLQLLHDKYQGKPIAIVLDNARYQHCKFIIELAQTLDIQLVFLPPYSPNLNLIERLWKFIKKNAIYTEYFESPAVFHQAVRTACLNVNHKKEWKSELQSLLALNFQSFENCHILDTKPKG